MNKVITKIILWVALGLLGSLLILFLLFRHGQDEGEKITIKKLLSVQTLMRLTKIYDIVINGLPDKEHSIISNVVRGLRTANSLYTEIFQIKRVDKFLKFIETEDLVVCDNKFILPLVFNTRLKELVKINNFSYDLGDGMFITSIVFPDGDRLFISTMVDPETGETVKNDNGGPTLAMNENFNMKSKLDSFWDFYKSGVFIHYSSDPSNNDENLVIEDLKTIEYKFYGKSSKYIDTFTKKLKKFRTSEVQRSYLFLGKPGTGKTSSCIEISKRVSSRFVKLSAELFTSFEREDFEFIFNCIRPDCVIVDDFDRVADSIPESDILFFFEQIKIEYPHITLFCTVNDIKRLDFAILRPGRFDNIEVFNLPNEKERKIILQSFIEEMKLDITLNDAQFSELVRETEGFSPAYLKEYILQLKYEPNIRALINRIKITREFADTTDFGSNDLDEEDDY